MIQATKNFSFEELSITTIGIPNDPDRVCKHHLLLLATYILQPIRDRFGIIKINSAYRSGHVNDLVGGGMNSQHLFGEAADIVSPQASLEMVYEWAARNLKYGQIILEDKPEKGGRWIHISLPRLGQNQQALVFRNGQYTAYILTI